MVAEGGGKTWTRAIPFVVIVVVLGLGIAFLAIQFARETGDTAKYVPPPPTPEPAPGPQPSPPPPPEPKPKPDPDPAPRTPPPPKPDPQDLARKEEGLRKLLEELETLKNKSYYSTALNLAEEFRDANPDFAERVDAQIVEISSFVKGAIAGCDKGLERGRGYIRNGDFPSAIGAAMTALSQVPDIEVKSRECRQMVDEIKRAALFADMVRIPAGSARVGDPVRVVELKGFRIDSAEVTNAQYYLFVLATDARRPDYWPRDGPPPAELAAKPVADVNAREAEAFAAWAGKRLPTEEEWERAARYVDGRAYPWGESHQIDGARVPSHCFDTLVASQFRGFWADVKSYPNGASPEGVYDLAGNVWEWTSTEVPQDGKALRVLKGGSFLTDFRACRAAARLPDDPGVRHKDVGFRCVVDLEDGR